MSVLVRDLRKDLEKTVKQARRVAEAGARKAVEQLRVGDGDAPKDLTADQRALRTRLRAHGRQLGDRRDAKTGVQETAHLVQECAYEHWHRMLFARFLAETDLLIEPDSGVAITLDEVQELAREKATDWLELASEYAERMLPQIFRKDDPVLQIVLPPETRSEIEDLLKGLSKPVFEADDSLGWVYQFWQADKKEEVNKSETKIGADELPAVTQLFTEDYMVLFLLHNTLGAWWAGKVLADRPNLATSAADEAALRAACKVGDIDWSYLRFVRDKGEGGTEKPWRPAAGSFEGWPKAAKDITVLDPCMGSGHFLVFALPILVAFRMAEENLSQSAAFDAVMRDNLFGMEIDPRCTQIAAFNLAFAAWRQVGFRLLPQLNLACSGLAIGVTKPEWLKLAETAVLGVDPAAKRDLLGIEKNLLTVGLEERVKNGLESLYDLFANAPWLGSLVDPRRAGADIFREGFDKLEPLLASILAAAESDDAREMAVAAQGMATSARLLSGRYSLVVTNVPYLTRQKQSQEIRDYSEAHFPDAKSELATTFLSRAIELTQIGGCTSVVIPQSWFSIKTYSRFRQSLLSSNTASAFVNLGPAAFNDMNWWAANTALVSIFHNPPNIDSQHLSMDASGTKDIAKKIEILVKCAPTISKQSAQILNPDSRITHHPIDSENLLFKYADAQQGITTGDLRRFGRCFWELTEFSEWKFWQGTTVQTKFFGGREMILRWSDPEGLLTEKAGATLRGASSWGLPAILVSLMNQLPVTLSSGEINDDNSARIIPTDPSMLDAIWCFCSSREYHDQIRRVDQSVKVMPQTLLKVSFDAERWSLEAARQFPRGLPAPWSDDPTQWVFDGDVRTSAAPLLTGISRLLGYRWPRQTGSHFLNTPAIEPDGLEPHADTDGIVCLTALKGEPPAEQRLNALLAGAFGSDWSAAKLASLLAEAGFSGQTLDDWLRDGFFAQHCDFFCQRPFIWHIWDGRRDGFHALINYHRLAAPNGEGRRTLEKLIYSYLGDWVDQQRTDQKAGAEGADARLAHAEQLKIELIKILEGEAPLDIFVRWKPFHHQPIGWDPDINDGVRINIRPFLTARPLNARGANACILRTTPKIKWDKDRGKEPARGKTDYPWFWGWDETTSNFAGGTAFDGNRWNDLHYSRVAKQSARDRASAGGKA